MKVEMGVYAAAGVAEAESETKRGGARGKGWWVWAAMVLVAAASVLGVFLLNSHTAFPLGLPLLGNLQDQQSKLETVLRRASMADKTVIVATLNDAWLEGGSIFDLFAQSFRIGNNTHRLLNHVVLFTWDHKAYTRCLDVHPHCHHMQAQAQAHPDSDSDYAKPVFFMTPTYLRMMWARTHFLASLLHLGYNFVFTDLDIMWLRDPFPHFFEHADFQIACDYFNGDSSDTRNLPNGGFIYAKSNPRTIAFYDLWLNSSKLYPTLNEQEVFNKIKTHPFVSHSNFTLRFLDTAYFGGFCQVSKDFNKVCTMHANCCVGLHNKINDLSILLRDWTTYMGLPPYKKQHSPPSWTVPQSCSTSFQRGKKKGNRK